MIIGKKQGTTVFLRCSCGHLDSLHRNDAMQACRRCDCDGFYQTDEEE